MLQFNSIPIYILYIATLCFLINSSFKMSVVRPQLQQSSHHFILKTSILNHLDFTTEECSEASHQRQVKAPLCV